MRTNKALLPFCGTHLITHQYVKLRALFSRVYIVCKPSQQGVLLDCLRGDFEKVAFGADSTKSMESLESSADSKANLTIKESDFVLENENLYTPLNGILSAFNALDSKEIFFITCDAPFVGKRTIQVLCANVNHYDVIYAKDSHHENPLIASWKDSMKGILEDALQNATATNVKIINLLQKCKAKGIYFDKDELFNINMHSDYKHALQLLKQQRGAI